MIKSEYIRNLNKNFERLQLEEPTDFKRYQYCILFRGGIKFLLPCCHKLIDNCNYLYYDISSSQNIKQIFMEKNITHEWMKEFLWSVQRMRQELNRFLLDERNVIWSPEHIFQDLEKKDFYYIYIPYCGQEGICEDEFEALLEFFVDRVDYEDSALVEFVYHVYEQFTSMGRVYLDKQIFDDFYKVQIRIDSEKAKSDYNCLSEKKVTDLNNDPVAEANISLESTVERKGIRSLLAKNRRKTEPQDVYRNEVRRMINGYAVCEEVEYKEKMDKKYVEEFGKTIYIEEKDEAIRGLFTENGELVIRIEKFPFVLGKRKEDVDFVLADYSASRLHARFLEEEGEIYLEDLNSTNGTFKNGLRMQPYEKRQIETEDVLRFGKSMFIYK